MKNKQMKPSDIALFLIIILLSVTLLTLYADSLKAQRVHIGNTALNEEFIESSIQIVVGGVKMTLLCSKDKNNKINKIIATPSDGVKNRAITKLEYSDIMSELNKSLGLRASSRMEFISEIITIIFNKIDYEVFIKTKLIQGSDNLFLTVIVTKL